MLEEVPGLLTINKVHKHKVSSTNTRCTQGVYGSMEGKDVINLVKEINDEKQRKLACKEKAMQDKLELKEKFYKCKENCVCDGKCKALGLKECPGCHNVLRSVCSKIACRGEDGTKPVMITGAGCHLSSKVKMKVVDYQSDETDESFTEDNATEETTPSDDSDSDNNAEIKVGDFVNIIKKPFDGLYAVVVNVSYGDELEIQYCEKRYGKWVLKEGDVDSREPTDMVKVDAKIDGREYYTFTC